MMPVNAGNSRNKILMTPLLRWKRWDCYTREMLKASAETTNLCEIFISKGRFGIASILTHSPIPKL